jgi:hypothetical protein
MRLIARWSAGFAIAGFAIAVAVMSASVPGTAGAQETSYNVLINGVMAGTASAVANLPADTVVVPQHADPNMPGKQVMTGSQGHVTITTSDPALIATIQAWVKADNTGFKDTVQRKSIEIDRNVGSKPPARFMLAGAWPTKLDTSGGSTIVEVVFQELTAVH